MTNEKLEADILELMEADQSEVLRCKPGSLRAVMAHSHIEAYWNVLRILTSKDAALRR